MPVDTNSEDRPRKGKRTRQQILERALDLASSHGLEGLTIGRLSSELGMSKSGLFGHFGSKTDLQLATVEAAMQRFEESVVNPALEDEPGLERLLHWLTLWADHIEHSPYRGGCFFQAASLEFDGRPGEVRDLVAKATGSWLAMLESELEAAKAARQIRKATDARQLSFELHAMVQQANWASQLLEIDNAFGMARQAMLSRLQQAVTPSGASLLRQT